MSWETAGFILALLGLIFGVPLTFLHIWAFLFGPILRLVSVSTLLLPSPFSINPWELKLLEQRVAALETLVLQGQWPPPIQPDPFEDLELVTTVRRSPRRRQADDTIDRLLGSSL